MIAFITSIVIAYLLGSMSTAILYCRLRGLPDPRKKGSKNPGATNVLRYAGKADAAWVLGGDIAKGLVAVLLARLLGVEEAMLGWIAFAAFFGHLYPVFFQFKGGKGVATALGGLLGFSWMVGIVALLVWLVVAAVWRYSSLAALAAALAAPVFAFLWEGYMGLLPVLLMSILLFLRHEQNIRNLLKRKETKIGE